MNKLLRANFNRLFKSKLFWLSSVFMFLLGLLPIDHWVSNKQGIADGYSEQMWYLDDGFFNYVIALFFIIAIMTALFVGAEYAGGTIRNKIVVGQKRTTIYFANLITLVTAIVIWSVIYIAVCLSVGVPLLGGFKCGLSDAIIFMLLALALLIALTGIMLMIAMLCQNRSYAAIICLMAVFAMLIAGVVVNSVLEEPEYYDGYTYLDTETGEMTKEEKTPNPNYVTGVKRKIYEEALDITSGGQMIQIVGMTAENCTKLAIYDLVIFAAATGVGIIFFIRKDLK